MMGGLKGRFELARVVLREVSREPCGQSVLEIRVLGKAGTPSTVKRMFYFLRDSGFIVKASGGHRAVNCVTDKGRKLLEALSMNGGE
jgi:predicted transcriptional regulator